MDTEPSRPSRDAGLVSVGRAGLFLTESLMHTLVSKGTLSREEFIEIVETAADVERESAMAAGAAPQNLRESVLAPLAHAFKLELGR